MESCCHLAPHLSLRPPRFFIPLSLHSLAAGSLRVVVRILLVSFFPPLPLQMYVALSLLSLASLLFSLSISPSLRSIPFGLSFSLHRFRLSFCKHSAAHVVMIISRSFISFICLLLSWLLTLS